MQNCSPSLPGVLVGSVWLQEDVRAGLPGFLVQDRAMLCQQGLARAGQVIKVFLLCDSVDPPDPSFLFHPACTACAHGCLLSSRAWGGGCTCMTTFNQSWQRFLWQPPVPMLRGVCP